MKVLFLSGQIAQRSVQQLLEMRPGLHAPQLRLGQLNSKTPYTLFSKQEALQGTPGGTRQGGN